MKKIAIYGASGHGKVIADIAELCGYEVAFFVDDDSSKSSFCGKDVLAFDDVRQKKDICFALGIGQNRAREAVFAKLLDNGFELPALIHPRATIASSVTIGNGSIVMANVVVNAYAKILDGVILNSSCVVEHDCLVEDFVHISPSASIAGGVSVGRLAHLGIGSSVIQCVRIGQGSVLGAGGVAIKDIEDFSLAVGVPAKRIKSI